MKWQIISIEKNTPYFIKTCWIILKNHPCFYEITGLLFLLFDDARPCFVHANISNMIT